jgi:hypothetical protein
MQPLDQGSERPLHRADRKRVAGWIRGALVQGDGQLDEESGEVAIHSRTLIAPQRRVKPPWTYPGENARP